MIHRSIEQLAQTPNPQNRVFQRVPEGDNRLANVQPPWSALYERKGVSQGINRNIEEVYLTRSI